MNQIVMLFGLMVMSLSVFSVETSTNIETKAKHEAIAQVLDHFHQAAADANTSKYFNLLTENAIFLGTDATERWTKSEFKSFVEPYFSKGRGWLYQTTERHITDVVAGEIVFLMNY